VRVKQGVINGFLAISLNWIMLILSFGVELVR
jgi:hypothetical protein